MITQGCLKELLHYDPETGVFTWVAPSGRRAKIGDVAGWASGRGYLGIRINRRAYYAHRLAWLYVHGAWPAQDIDHVNGVRSDNRLANLREATRSQNLANTRPRRSAPKGTWLHRETGKWCAAITVNGRLRHLGLFASRDDAHAAYAAAANQHFGEFARTA